MIINIEYESFDFVGILAWLFTKVLLHVLILFALSLDLAVFHQFHPFLSSFLVDI